MQIIVLFFSLINSVDFRETINFEITETQTKTIDKNGKVTISSSYIVEFVTTFLKFSNVAETVQPKSPSNINEDEFKYIYFRPKYCIGLTSVALMIICYIYTSCCYPKKAQEYASKIRNEERLRAQQIHENLLRQIIFKRNELRKIKEESSSENEI